MYYDQILVVSGSLGMMAFGFIFMQTYFKQRFEIRRLTIEEEEKKRQSESDSQFRMLELELKKEELKYKYNIRETKNEDESKTKNDDHMEIDIEESKKKLVVDLLLSFEEYALLKGYKVSISINKEHLNKLYVKFTIHENSVSEEDVIKDVREFTENFANNNLNEDYLKSKSTINNTEKENIIISDIQKRTNIIPRENFEGFNIIINNHIEGGDMNQGKYIAANSSNAVQGNKNKNNVLGNNKNINIGNTFAERQKRIEKINELLEIFKQTSHKNENEENIERNLQNIKEELKTAENPDISYIEKSMSKIENSLNILEKGSELVTKALPYYEALKSLFVN